MLATREAVAEFQARVNALESSLGSRPDPDILVMHAIVRWEVGTTRSDEHVAASLGTRALRLAPRGFALAPLARAYVETYLDSPAANEGSWSRDSATLDEMRNALAQSAPSSPVSPFAATVELAGQMRRLAHVSNEHYVAMVEAHVAVVAQSRRLPRNDDALKAALRCRATEAKAIVEAWQRFDASLVTFPDRLALNAFHLNDAILTRASSFLENPGALSEPPRIEDIPAKPSTLGQRLRVAPARVAWARRYGSLFSGPLRPIVEFEEAERFRTWEHWAIELERASVQHALAAAGEERVLAAWRVALAATALALYVDSDGRRVPYASIIGKTISGAPPPGIIVQTPNAPLSLDEALSTRGPHLI